MGLASLVSDLGSGISGISGISIDSGLEGDTLDAEEGGRVRVDV